MSPLFVSYAGKTKGQFTQGWVVLVSYPMLSTPEDMTNLVKHLEVERGYDPGTFVIINFRRLET